jgi:transcriptional regulator with XRE-family HTH domain
MYKPDSNLLEMVAHYDVMNFGQEIKKLRERLHLTQKEVADATGATTNSVSKWERLSTIDGIYAKNLRKLAEVLKTTPEELAKLSPPRRIEQSIGDPISRRLPVINKAPAGPVVDYDECGVDTGIGMSYIDRQGESDPNAFVVVVTGDSMNKSFNEGDFVVFLPMDPDGHTHNGRVPVAEGHICYIRFSAESKYTGCTIAAVHRMKDGTIKLVKENKKYKPMIVRPDEIANMAAYGSMRRIGLPGQIRLYPPTDQLQMAGAREGQVHPSYD